MLEHPNDSVNLLCQLAGPEARLQPSERDHLWATLRALPPAQSHDDCVPSPTWEPRDEPAPSLAPVITLDQARPPSLSSATTPWLAGSLIALAAATLLVVMIQSNDPSTPKPSADRGHDDAITAAFDDHTLKGSQPHTSASPQPGVRLELFAGRYTPQGLQVSSPLGDRGLIHRHEAVLFRYAIDTPSYIYLFAAHDDAPPELLWAPQKRFDARRQHEIAADGQALAFQPQHANTLSFALLASSQPLTLNNTSLDRMTRSALRRLCLTCGLALQTLRVSE